MMRPKLNSHHKRSRLLGFVFTLPTLVVSAHIASAEEPPIRDAEGRPVVSWEMAAQVLGKTAFVVGKVERIGHARTIHFLNFHPTDRDKFTAVIFDPQMSNFPGRLEDLYEGKLVKLRGVVSSYRNVPQIVLSSPKQIEVIEALPEFQLPPADVSAPIVGDLRIATYNVLNLFDEHDDPYRADEGTPTKAREELERLAQTIRNVNADVIALQEVESRAYLERFVDVFLADDGYRHVVHLESNDQRGIDNAVLSRLPVGNVTSQRHRRFLDESGTRRSFNRDLLQVEVLPQSGTPIELWVVHLKSNSGGREFAEPIRLAEVQEIRRLYDARMQREPEARILVLGDFNDTIDSQALTTLMGSKQHALQSFVAEVHGNDAITYNKEPHRSMIDFILASPAAVSSYRPGTYRIVPGTVTSSGSDHNPVLLEIAP